MNDKRRVKFPPFPEQRPPLPEGDKYDPNKGDYLGKRNPRKDKRDFKKKYGDDYEDIWN